jgi:hypothetical protein
MSHAPTSNQPSVTLLFTLGQVVATPGALDLLDRTATNAQDLLLRHQRGDWGCVPAEDAAENQNSIKTGCRILSSYFLNDSERLWIITEADRSATTLLLPDEY